MSKEYIEYICIYRLPMFQQTKIFSKRTLNEILNVSQIKSTNLFKVSLNLP